MNQLTSDPATKRRRVKSDGCRPDDRGADVYDTLHRTSKPYAAEAAALTNLIFARVADARSLLDVACGTGEHLRHLATAFDVQGVDASDAMVDIALPKLPGIALHRDDTRSFRLGRRFDAVTCLFSSIGYLRSIAALNAAIASVLRMDYTIASGGGSSTFNEEHRLRLFSFEEYLNAMYSAGLTVEDDPLGLTG